jgi:hypothetical protein
MVFVPRRHVEIAVEPGKPPSGQFVGKRNPANSSSASRDQEFSKHGVDPPENQGHFYLSYRTGLNIPGSRIGADSLMS